MPISCDLAAQPLVVTWELTRGAAEGLPGGRERGDLSARECLDVVDQIAAARPRLVLLSADVSTRADVTQLIARANAHGLRVALRPAIRDRFLDLDCGLLVKAGTRCLSICLGENGATRSGRVATALKILAAARRAHLPVQIKSPLPQTGDLERFCAAARALRPAEWRFTLPVDEPVNPVEVERLLRAIAPLPRVTGVPISVSDAPQLRRINLQEHLRPARRPHRPVPLNDGRGKLHVTPRGEILPGRTLPVIGGDTRRHHLLDVYRESAIFQRLRDADQLQGKCGSCEFRCVCGGSRARAFFLNGNYLAADPACPHRPLPSSRAPHPAASSSR